MSTQNDSRDIDDKKPSQLLDEEMTKFDWERQYFRSDEEPMFAFMGPIILIGGSIIAALIIWLFVSPN